MGKNNNKSIVSISVIIIFVLLVIGIGGKTYMSNKDSEKLANQKEAAVKIKTIISGLEEIKFESDGGKFSGTENDFGSWSIGADLKLSDSERYKITASKKGVKGMKRGFPDKNMHGGTLSDVKIIYSNGESEIIK